MAVAFLALERDAAVVAWSEGLRLDRRANDEPRALKVEFPFSERGKAILRVGDSAVVACVSCDLVDPAPHAPKLGFIEFSVRGDVTRQQAAEVAVELDALLRRGHAIDPEGLCVLPGRKVWSLRVDVCVINNDGNFADAVAWGALVALLHFRRPELSIRNDEVLVHAPEDRDPIPLAIHHLPFPVTFVVKKDGSDILLDPRLPEQAAGKGLLTVAVNLEKEVCWIQKKGGCGVQYALIERATDVARKVVPEIHGVLTKALAEDEARRKAAALNQFAWAQKRVGVGKLPAGPPQPAAGPPASAAAAPVKRPRQES